MFNDLSSVLALLKSRKSASAKAMGEPGPSADELKEILAIAARVPDHGKLAPWRFIILQGEARQQLGELFAKRWHELHPDHGPEMLKQQAGLLLRAPIVVAVVSCAQPHVKIPEWEQVLSAGAVCHNLLLAATAMGFGAQWNTGWVAFDGEALKAIGLAPSEKLAGLIYIGTSTVALEERDRPDVAALTQYWGQ